MVFSVTDILTCLLTTGRVNGPRMRMPCRIPQNHSRKSFSKGHQTILDKTVTGLLGLLTDQLEKNKSLHETIFYLSPPSSLRIHILKGDNIKVVILKTATLAFCKLSRITKKKISLQMSQPRFQLSSLTKLKFILLLINFLSSVLPVYQKKKKISNIKCFITF